MFPFLSCIGLSKATVRTLFTILSSLTCGDGTHNGLRGYCPMHSYKVHYIFSGWLQPHQDGMPLGGIQEDLHRLFLVISGAVVQNESVCWGRWVTPGDVDTGGGHMRKVQMGDRAEACKIEKHVLKHMCGSRSLGRQDS